MPDSFSHPTLPEALSFLDLPAVPEPLPGPGAVPAPPVPPVPAVPSLDAGGKPGEGAVQVMAPLLVKLWPPQGKGAPGLPRVALKAPVPAVAPRAYPATPRAPLLLPAPSKAPSSAPVLRLALPPGTGEGELEVVVTVRRDGVTLAEGATHRPSPAPGAIGHLAVEIKGL